MRRVPATEASLQLDHVEDCRCHYTDDGDNTLKLIDARCISAYLVPEQDGIAYPEDPYE